MQKIKITLRLRYRLSKTSVSASFRLTKIYARASSLATKMRGQARFNYVVANSNSLARSFMFIIALN